MEHFCLHNIHIPSLLQHGVSWRGAVEQVDNTVFLQRSVAISKGNIVMTAMFGVAMT